MCTPYKSSRTLGKTLGFYISSSALSFMSLLIVNLPSQGVSLDPNSYLSKNTQIIEGSHFRAEFTNHYVTTGDPDNYVVNSPSFFDGVAALILNTSLGQRDCSGSLLSSGKYILTAAHCLTDGEGNLITSESVAIFNLPLGPEILYGSEFFIHPDWDGNLIKGNDIALIKLNDVAPDNITRYQLYTDSDEVGQVGEKVGYGWTGTGNTGREEFGDWQRRKGQNRYDALGDLMLTDLGLTPRVDFVPGSMLVYDFDNGNAANDGFGVLYGIHDLGVGDGEVNSAPGDSGSPTFIGGKIVGINSLGFGLGRDGISPDIDGQSNSSFGEFSADTRVSLYANWVARTQSIQEPNQLVGLISCGLLAWLSKKN